MTGEHEANVVLASFASTLPKEMFEIRERLFAMMATRFSYFFDGSR